MKRFYRYFFPLVCTCLCVLTACKPEIPADYKALSEAPVIYPDYTDVTIPPNIAPLHFAIREEGDRFLTRFVGKGSEIVCEGREVKPSVDEWHALLESSKGGELSVETFVSRGGAWSKFRSFVLHVAEEPIDEYLSYRLIAPSYVTYEELTINQRNLTNYEENEIYNNMLVASYREGHCINCHSYQNYSPENMQFHARQSYGGTMIVVDGKPQKVDLKTDSTISGGVYPSWHPKQKVIAYSVNTTGQSFHTKHPQKVEVQDSHSDLILYDIEANTVQKIVAAPDELEIFPWWSPEGDYLYYCSAHYQYDEKGGDRALMDIYDSIHYSLYRIPYDMKKRTFGTQEMVFDAASLQKSATLPRISPDGRWLVFALGDYGCFHIWHKSSDLWIIDLGTDPAHADIEAIRRSARNLEGINSPDVESYHSWSSNGRWMVVSSRRDDGNYTRPYFSYIDREGKARKPFILPQDAPEFYLDFFRSYNIPEFMKAPVEISPQEFARLFRGEAKKAAYKGFARD